MSPVKDQERQSLRQWANEYINIMGRQELIGKTIPTKEERHLLWLAHGVVSMDKKMKRRDKELSRLQQLDMIGRSGD